MEFTEFTRKNFSVPTFLSLEQSFELGSTETKERSYHPRKAGSIFLCYPKEPIKNKK